MNEVVTSSRQQMLDSTSSSISLTKTLVQSQGHLPFYSKLNSKDIGGKFSVASENFPELVRLFIVSSLYLVVALITLLLPFLIQNNCVHLSVLTNVAL